MRYPRYIIEKPINAFPENHEADFEKNSTYFLTPRSVIPPDCDQEPKLEHVRYGVNNFSAQNCDMGISDRQFGFPVHDTCWKIFEQVCNAKIGMVDLQGLVALWWVSQ